MHPYITSVTPESTRDINIRDHGQGNAKKLHRPRGDDETAAAEATEEGPRPDALEDPAGQAEVGRSRPRSRGGPRNGATQGRRHSNRDATLSTRGRFAERTARSLRHFLTQQTD